MPDPGWYDDPQDQTQLRWWDGSRWTKRRQPRSTAMPPPAGASYGISLSTPPRSPVDPWASSGTPSGFGQPTPPPTYAESDSWSDPQSPRDRWTGGPYPAASVSFQEAIASGFRNYAVFRGRASRSEYWYWALFLLLAAFGVGVVLGFILTVMFDEFVIDSLLFDVLFYLLLLPLLLPTLAVTARRLHDAGMSAWFILLEFIPWLGVVASIIFGLLPGQDHANEYG